MSRLFGPILEYRHPRIEVEVANCLFEERGASFARVEQNPLRRRPLQRKHQPRDSCAATQIQGPPRFANRVHEGRCVIEVVFDRPGAEEPEPLRSKEDVLERLGQLSSAVGAGEMTTRRRGSSPSELVTTPSSSLTVS